MANRVNIHAVSRRANCSIATVSRVLNGSASTSAAVRERVQRAVQELDFRPNEVGRALQSQRMRTIGVLVPSLDNPVFASSVAGIQRVARDRGYGVLVGTSDYQPQREQEAVETLLSQAVDGLVMTVADPESAILDTLDRGDWPYILLYNQPQQGRRQAVSVDNVAAAREATEELIARGHRNIRFVAGDFSASDRSRRRHEGFVAALTAAGLRPREAIEVGFQDTSYQAALTDIVRADDPPSAILCSTDLLALTVIKDLRSLGFTVPDHISVVGFDGIAVAGLVSPPLATVRQPSEAMGATAMEHLFKRIDGDGQTGTSLLPHHFDPGGTIGPPASLASRHTEIAS